MTRPRGNLWNTGIDRWSLAFVSVVIVIVMMMVITTA